MSDDRSEVERNAQSNIEMSMASQSQMQNAIGDPSNDRLPIFKLKMDHFEELFEYLPLADLLGLRQTCKNMNQYTNHFIKTNYPAVKFGYGKIRLGSKEKFDELRQMDSTAMTIIKHARITVDDIVRNQIDILKDVFPLLERLEIRICDSEFDFYESILKWCSNLKYLLFFHDPSHPLLTADENEWRRRQYPMIDHIGILSANPMAEWRTFFELNPNIQTLTIEFNELWSLRNYFLGSNIKLDGVNLMAIFEDLESVSDLLNELHEQGFYKRLYLYVWYIGQDDLNKIKLFIGLERLYLKDSKEELSQPTLPPLSELKELCFDADSDQNYDNIAKSLINVERVRFAEATIDQIISFICYAPKVKEIKVDCLFDGAYYEKDIINLSALNKKRQGLAGAQKITIYVHESVFIRTKMASMKTEFSLITLKRAEAVKWAHKDTWQ